MSCMKCLTNLAAALVKRSMDEEKSIVFTRVCVTQNIEKTNRSELIGKQESWYGANKGSVQACLSHFNMNAAACVCNARLGIKITDNSKAWKTISVWGKLEGDAADCLLYAESDDNGSYNNGLVIELPISLADAVEDFGSISDSASGEVTPADLLALGASIDYDSTDHEIHLKNSAGTVLATVDASDFIVDGMVDNVYIDSTTDPNNPALVIEFNTDAGKQDISIPLSDIFDPDDYLTKAEIQSTYTPTADLAAVALDGEYSSLLNPPTIPTVNNAKLTIKKNNSDSGSEFTANASSDVICNLGLADVATSGSYADLSNTPTIGEATLTIKKNTDDSGTAFSANATSNVSVNLGISAVGLSGDYGDLLNKPSIPVVNNAKLTIKKNSSDSGSEFTANASSDVTCNLGLADVATSGSYADLSNTPSLATVATSGSYSDLSNQPTIGTATLTIKANSSDTGTTFSANATSDVTCNLGISAVGLSGNYSDLISPPTIPTVNDSTVTIKRYAADTGDSFTLNQSSAKNIDLDLKSLFYTKAEIDSDYLASAVYDSTTHILTLTSADGTKVITLTLT